MDGDMMRAMEADLRFATHLRAMSRVAVATSHDIRTPLHTIILYLELLRNTIAEKTQGSPAERQERYVEVIGSELQRLEAMMEGLLGQIRVTEEKVERFDLHELVSQLRTFLEPQCRKTRVEIRLEPAASPVVVQANKDSVRHALLHILATSVEAGSEEGAVDVSVLVSDGAAVVSIGGDLSGLSPAILDGEPRAEDAFGAERGLFAARRVVEGWGGGIKLRTGALGAASLEINLPLAAAE
jgi:signal transduction histidine kinase